MKLSRYNYVKRLSDDCLGIYNTAANTITFLDDADYAAMTHELREVSHVYCDKGIVVEDDVDELARVLDLEELASTSDFDVRLYTILTTTACNAACPYCYESSWSSESMSKDAAIKIAEYINSDSKPDDEIHIGWFGGEPLLKMRSIETIIAYLNDECGRPVNSRITTNGSLITKSLVKKLKKMGFSSVQVTLDGLEDEYGTIKRYKSVPPNAIEIGSVSPFEGLLHSLDLLLENEIHVQVRVNVGSDYSEKMPEIQSFLEGRFPEKGFSLYFAPIDSLTANGDILTANQQLSDFYSASVRLGMAWRDYSDPDDLLYPYLTTHCGACVSYHKTIKPDGALGKCHRDSTFAIGHVDDGNKHLEGVSYYDFAHSQECLKCIFLPTCHGGCRYKAKYADYALAKCCSLRFDIDARLECAYELFLNSARTNAELRS